jgi:hypothetical protein
MIRQLARCPFCGGCEVALDDRPELVLDPDGAGKPCAHLAWVDGRYSQWDKSPQGVTRVIGSIEFRWDPPEPSTAERTEQLLPYLKLLVTANPGWAFAPPVDFRVLTLSAEEKAVDKRGKTYTAWDVDGWAVFAVDPAAFWAALPACQEQHLASLEVTEEGGPS